MVITQGEGSKLNYIPIEADLKTSLLLGMSEITIIVLLSLFFNVIRAYSITIRVTFTTHDRGMNRAEFARMKLMVPCIATGVPFIMAA